MAIALAALLRGFRSYRIQKEGPSTPEYTHIWTFDPDGILQQTLNPQITLTGREQIADEVLQLHSRVEQILGLLAKASGFQEKLGDKQVVLMQELDRAEKSIRGPVAIDIIDLTRVQEQKQLSSLMLFQVSQSEVYELPQIDIVFVTNPKNLQENRQATLDPARSFSFDEDYEGRIMKYGFYQRPNMPQGIGVIVTYLQGIRFDRALLLAYQPAERDQITPAALGAVSDFLNLDVQSYF